MPNWCSTTYRIYGPEDKRKELVSILDHLNSLEKPYVENGFCKLWLGCLVSYLGGDCNNIYCRGDIQYYDNCDDYLQIDTETAWGEMSETRHFLEEKYPDLTFYYISEEPGMCEYYTNDLDGKVFPWNYRLDIGADDWIICDDFRTVEDVAAAINEECIDGLTVPNTFEGITEALDKYREEHDDFYGDIYEYQKVND